MPITTADGQQQLTYEEKLAIAKAKAAGGPETTAQETLIPRWTPTGPLRDLGPPRPGSPFRARTTSTLPEYMQEFFTRWEDPNFQTWVMSRAIASGVNGKTATYNDYLDVWEKAGKTAAAISTAGRPITPEQYLEWAASGNQLSPDEIEKAIGDGTPIFDKDGNPVLPGVGANVPAEPANPITNYRSTSSATINREAAYAAVDQLSQALLGRMATKAEMRRARGVMNRMLAANPTVTTRTVDQTDPNNIVESSHTNTGMSAADAQAALQMKIQRSSEGTAYTVGSMFEDAMRILAAGEG